jgi:hypothetical protein
MIDAWFIKHIDGEHQSWQHFAIGIILQSFFYRIRLVMLRLMRHVLIIKLNAYEV